MANIAVPGVAVTYRALLSCVSRASTGLSKHGPVGRCTRSARTRDGGFAAFTGPLGAALPRLDKSWPRLRRVC